MWKKRVSHYRGGSKFFILGLSHDNLVNYYKTNSALVYHHKYSITELEDMLPYEREIYITLLSEHVRQHNEEIERINNRNR